MYGTKAVTDTKGFILVVLTLHTTRAMVQHLFLISTMNGGITDDNGTQKMALEYAGNSTLKWALKCNLLTLSNSFGDSSGIFIEGTTVNHINNALLY